MFKVNTMKDVENIIWSQAKTKLKLFAGMLIAAVTAAIAIDLSVYLAMGTEFGFFESLGIFLAARVVLFMANPSMPLNDTNVQFMSEQRILWNLATLAVLSVAFAVKLAIQR